MNLKHPFSQEDRYLFFDAQHECWICGGNQQMELHHICGRKSSSPLNGAPLCKECHNKIGHSESEEKMLFAKTLKYLTRNQYVITEKDYDFINNYQRLHQVVFEG